MNKFISAILAGLFVIFASACSSAKAAPVVQSWDGSWATNPSFMTVDIAAGKITINIVADDETKALFWQGSWDESVQTKNGATLVSTADRDILDRSLFGSQEKTKSFTYKNHQLLFGFSMMGASKVVHVNKL